MSTEIPETAPNYLCDSAAVQLYIFALLSFKAMIFNIRSLQTQVYNSMVAVTQTCW